MNNANFTAQRTLPIIRRSRQTEMEVLPASRIPVLLTILADRNYDSMDAEHTELLSEGVMELRPEALSITYRESTLTGMEGTTTTLEVKGSRVILRRIGTVSSQMVFEEGKQHTSLYETPYGEMSIDIQTSYLRHTLTERGGRMEIHYSISIEHTATGKNRFQLLVKRRQRGE